MHATMKRSFEYKTDRRTVIRTVLLCVLFVVIAVALVFLYKGGYLSAWFTSVIIALVALMTLSIPRRIVLLDHTLEIQCILDITEINIREIASVRRVDRRRMRWIVPLLGGIGFFGYYGKYFDLKEFDTVNMYASEWNNFVEITDIYDSRTYVSCREADELIAATYANTGFIAQNVYLFCASESLATVVRAMVDRDKLAAAMALPDNSMITLVQTVGYPAAK